MRLRIEHWDVESIYCLSFCSLIADFSKEFVLQTDACTDSVGGILFQEEAGVKHPVAFASKKLLPWERN